MSAIMLESILQQFESMSMDTLMLRADLMDRSDRKFAFHKQDLHEILEACLIDYYVLEIGTNRHFDYETEYFDTADRWLYFQHHRGKANRYKVRRRLYGSTGEEYIEVKHKTNKGNTQKLRVKGQKLSDANELLHAHIGEALTAALEPSLMVRYQRITLLHKAKNEKVTLDFDISWAGTGENPTETSHRIDFQNVVIAEVKSTNLHFNSFEGIVKKRGIREGSLSKYCLGCLAVYPNIKQNRFKQTYNHILSIEHAS